MGDFDEIRRELIIRARQKDRRRSAFTDLRPCVWKPEDVLTEYGIPFTSEGAWQFIADQLEDGQPLEEVALHNPPGEVAFVMKIDIGAHVPIYIKIQLHRDWILGRSFHYSS